MTENEYFDREFNVDDPTIETHKFAPHPEAAQGSFTACNHCGFWRLHHLHTGNRQACMCKDPKCRTE